MQETASGLYLPATRMIARLVQQCVDRRRRASSGHVNISASPLSLFTSGDTLLDAVGDILAARHPVGFQRARRATTTAEAVARWLPAELIGAAGGDPVLASVTVGRVLDQAETPIYYGAARHDRLVDRYRAAVGSIDELSHGIIPAEVVTSYLGDRRTPTDDAVRDLIGSLARDLADASHDAADRHHAITSYTVGMLCFALAHRGDSGTMPSLRDLHRETGLCWIEDKSISGRPSRRLVWISDMMLEQLRLYDAHLDQLQTLVSAPAAAAIGQLRDAAGLPLFDMRSGRIEPMKVSRAVGVAMGIAGLPKNSGRHWLRSKLVGTCSTVTLHALFGHGPVDEGSWDAMSGLDPALFRADLARVLDPALAAAGWKCRAIGGARL